ncbi:hypothetical protein Tco_0937964 [Tanacetum coccineum]|uniref:Uncharacterized protein n=1 Tax=Tanacetum coccineum TaxID=301880 RepID=A0ABQ5DLZ6_9ASTR
MALVPVGEWLKFNNRLDFEEFGALYEGTALQNLDQFFHVSFEQDDRRFTSQDWNRLFRIKEQLGEERRRRHSGKEKVTLQDLFLLHSIDGGVGVDVPWHVAKFLCNKAKGFKRKSPIVGAYLIGKIASYYGLMTLGSLMNVTLGFETSSMSIAKLVDLVICMYNGLGIGEMVTEIPEVAGDDDGVNLISGTPGYSIALSPSASQFGMFGDAHPSTSRNQDDMNED